MPTAAGRQRRCQTERADSFPRIDPAVIVGVRDPDDRLLLVRHVGSLSGRFSLVAGFAEFGETLESAVVREVIEETGLELSQLAYVDSQAWPYPANLMISFDAVATSTEFRVQAEELIEARWFERSQLSAAVATGRVRLSSPASIAYHMVVRWHGEGLPRSLTW